MWNPTEEHMRCMLKRLGKLKDERVWAEELGFRVWTGDEYRRTKGVLGMIDSEIWWQKESIRKAIRINPALEALVEDRTILEETSREVHH